MPAGTRRSAGETRLVSACHPGVPSRVLRFGDTVVVTGASSGIGRATAHGLAGRGTHLVLVSRSAAALADVAAECTAAGASRVDVVVHAAAVATYGLVHQTPPDVLERLVETNLLGSVHVGTAAVRIFRRRRTGRLVLLGSVVGDAPVTVLGPYAVTKSGVHALARVLRQESRDLPDVHVTLVAPGAVNTPLYDQAAVFTDGSGRPPPPVSSPAAVATAVVDELMRDRPRRAVSVGRLNPVIRLAHARTPALFDALIGPAMRVLALGPPTGLGPGNLFAAVSEHEATDGRWSVPWGRAQRPAAGVSGGPAGTAGPVPGADSLPTVQRHVDAPPSAVASVLEDGWSYASWVVGTARIRAVSPGWPTPQARLHHSVGLWPALLSDETVCREYEPGRRLVLVAKGRPFGEAVVDIEIEPDDEGCTVSISEDAATSGIRSVVPQAVRNPMIKARNTETLRRLALLAERADRPGD